MLLIKNGSPQKDEEPSIQALTAHSAHLLSRLANNLLAAEPRDVSAGLRVIRDELLVLAADIRDLEPEFDVNELLTHPPSDGYTLEQMMAILDRR